MSTPGNREINLDPQEHCFEHGVKFAICGPAHTTPHMYYVPTGLLFARNPCADNFCPLSEWPHAKGVCVRYLEELGARAVLQDKYDAARAEIARLLQRLEQVKGVLT